MPVWTYANPPDQPPLPLRNLAAVGRCIYCDSERRLTTEHVVPAGMRGRITLKEASCLRCAEKTQTVETMCMRQTLLIHRIQHDLHRHENETPLTKRVKFEYWNGKTVYRDLPRKDVPIPAPLPILQYPGILRDVAPENTSTGQLTVFPDLKNDEKFKALLATPGVKTVTVESTKVRIDLFYRWLAKIAYSYAVACLGYHKIRHSPLRNIATEGGDNPNYFIGGLNNWHPSSDEYWLESPTDEIFRVSLSDMVLSPGKIGWVIYIRLLPRQSLPSYVVVVGERI